MVVDVSGDQRAGGPEQTRRTILKTLVGAGALLASSSVSYLALGDDTDPRAAKIVADTISVDMHNHMPQNFAKTPAEAKPDPDIDLPGEMKKSGLTAICATYAVDGYRTPQPGDWYEFHLQELGYIDRLLAKSDMRRALTMADLKTAHSAKMPIIVQDCEGAQWIEGKIERVEEAYQRGLRHMQLVHQMHDLVAPLAGVQQLIQPKGGGAGSNAANVSGLTDFGAKVIRECNRLGIVVDMAHASEAAVLQAIKVARQPFVVTHAALDTPIAREDKQYTGNPGLTARLVSPTYAKAVAEMGGVVGIWHIFPTMKDFVTGIKQMVDVVGVDHAGIGTDTSVAPPAGGRGGGTNAIWPDDRGGFLYAVVGEMLAQGFHPDEISNIIGGNYCRIFERVTARKV